jgi:hypothetical protein
MAERLVLDLFCEDSGHEVFVTNLVRIMARSLTVPEPLVKPISARGGRNDASLNHLVGDLRALLQRSR